MTVEAGQEWITRGGRVVKVIRRLHQGVCVVSPGPGERTWLVNDQGLVVGEGRTIDNLSSLVTEVAKTPARCPHCDHELP